MDKARRAMLLGKACSVRDWVNANIEALEAGKLDDESAKRIDDAWEAYHGVRDELHVARMIWLSALDCSRTAEVWNAMGARERGQTLTSDQKRLLERPTYALKRAQVLRAAHGDGGRPGRAETTLEVQIYFVRTWVEGSGLPEYRDSLSDGQIAKAIEEWNRKGGRRPNLDPKWVALADIFKSARLFNGKGSTLAQEWKEWPK